MKAIILFLLTLIITTADAQHLRTGDPAPPFSAWKWIKGKPVGEFRSGTIYIIEFGATWCAPCAEAIPELSALADKYDHDAKVISVFVMEQMSRGQNPYGGNVEKYVKKRGDQMRYTVALDSPEGTLQKTWLNAAGSSGIPFTIVVDREGKIAWTGHSIKELTKTMEELCDKD
ncbi:MAG TPA: TlpA disulfide reductase family protein [Ohtaekwangia sp.]